MKRPANPAAILESLRNSQENYAVRLFGSAEPISPNLAAQIDKLTKDFPVNLHEWIDGDVTL